VSLYIRYLLTLHFQFYDPSVASITASLLLCALKLLLIIDIHLTALVRLGVSNKKYNQQNNKIS
jgi:hypothetical protein